MKNAVVLVFSLLLPFIGAEASEHKPYEMPRTHVAPIRDGKTDRQYELYIKLPEDYSENADQKYPVLYTTDAAWHMDMLSGATEYLLANVILVGVSWQKDLGEERPFASRFRDYTFVESGNPELQARYQFGQASEHLAFIRDDVINYVENNFRADPGERIYFGYSLGGAFGAYVLLAEPDLFKNYILGSPAVDEQDIAFLDDLETRTASRRKRFAANVFVSIGEREEDQMAVTNELLSLLQRRREAGLTLTGLEIIEDSDHGAAFPVTVIRGVKWLSRQESE